jgi:hypothetical protein
MILCIMKVVSYTNIICMILRYDTTHYGQPMIGLSRTARLRRDCCRGSEGETASLTLEGCRQIEESTMGLLCRCGVVTRRP